MLHTDGILNFLLGQAAPAAATMSVTSLGKPTLASIGFFFLIIVVTLVITYWAARKTKTSSEFYAAGRSVSALQNGFALAGDYMSAASFLGISGMVALSGYDGMIYATGWLVGWPALMFLVAEPLRNLGKFTFADVVAFRLKNKPVRIAAAIGSILTVLFYTIAQMVGSGQLVSLMFGLKYEYAELIVGSVMLAYVLFGGMLATTWVQIIKAVLLLFGVTILTAMVLSKFGWNPANLYAEVSAKYGDAALQPGGQVSSPVEAISLGLALMFGLLGLPHILMRFYTVPDAKAARKSVLYATSSPRWPAAATWPRRSSASSSAARPSSASSPRSPSPPSSRSSPGSRSPVPRPTRTTSTCRSSSTAARARRSRSRLPGSPRSSSASSPSASASSSRARTSPSWSASPSRSPPRPTSRRS
jgi:cation/acetate symporter